MEHSGKEKADAGPNGYVTPKEIEEILRRSRTTVYRLLKERGVTPHFTRASPRKPVYKREDIMALATPVPKEVGESNGNN